jgi:peptide/nickel transport system permease protein
VFGGGVLLLLLVFALAAKWVAPHDPLDQDLMNSFLPPFWQANADPSFLLGTDSLGRDILSRLIYGTRIALTVAVIAAAGAGIIGTVLGLAAGFVGGKVDALISRLVEIWMAFPPVLLATVLVTILGSGVQAVIIAVIIIDWTRFCRIVRAETMVQLSQDYAASARVLGMRRFAMLMGEILPNLLPLLLVLFSLEMATAVIVEAIQSFLGFSVAGGEPSWGGLIRDGRLYVNQAWWLMAMPMGAIVLTVLALNALGDGLRLALDPILR